MNAEQQGLETTRQVSLFRPDRTPTAAWSGLPLDILQTAARRIGYFALVLAFGFCIAIVISFVLYWNDPQPAWMPISRLLDVAMIASSIFIFVASRS